MIISILERHFHFHKPTAQVLGSKRSKKLPSILFVVVSGNTGQSHLSNTYKVASGHISRAELW